MTKIVVITIGLLMWAGVHAGAIVITPTLWHHGSSAAFDMMITMWLVLLVIDFYLFFGISEKVDRRG